MQRQSPDSAAGRNILLSADRRTGDCCGAIASGTIRPSCAAIARRFGEDKRAATEAEAKTARDFLDDLRPTGLFKGALGIAARAVRHTERRRDIGTGFDRGGTLRMGIGGLHPAKFHAEPLRMALAAGPSALPTPR